MKNKNIKVLFLKDYNNKILKECRNIWIKVEKILLEKGYTFKYYYLENRYLNKPDYFLEIFEKVNKGIYDIVIIPYNRFSYSKFTDLKDNVSFTDTLYIQKQLILYKLRKEFENPYVILYKKLFKLWIYFVIMTLLISVFLYFLDSKFVLYNNKLASYFIFFLGADKEFISKAKKINIYSCLFFIVIALLIYLLTLTINSLTLSTSAVFSIPKNSISRELHKQKILIDDNKYLRNLLKKSNAIPVISKRKPGIDMVKEYMERNDLNGISIDFVHLKNYKIIKGDIFFPEIKKSLSISDVNFSYIGYSFPVNIKKYHLYRDINDFLEIYNKGLKI